VFVLFAETDESVLVITGITGRINRAVWGPGNRTIITAGEDATVRIWDSEVSTYSFPLLLNITSWVDAEI
jgi:WD40 repeat protein